MARPSSLPCARSLLRAQDAQPDDVLGADGYLFATPENLASMSGLMKDFFDRYVLRGARPDQRQAVRRDGLRGQ